MANKEQIWPDIAIPPGEILLEEIEARNLSQRELARRTGRPVPTINEIVKGKKEITSETAIQLERVLDIPADFWINLQKNYEFNLARLNDKKKLVKESSKLKSYPIREMVKLGWIKKGEDKIDQTSELLRFFAVGSFDEIYPLYASFRKTGKGRVNENALMCWLRKTEIEAQKIEVNDFKREGIFRELDIMRKLTLESPGKFIPQLKQICSENGIAFVLVPELKCIGASGAAYWYRTNTPVIALNLRYKSNDKFWFSFFHELGHLLYGKKKQRYVDYLHTSIDLTVDDPGEEEKVNRFASNVLIPPEQYSVFVHSLPISINELRSLAKEYKIHPGIVVGRLQYDGHLSYSHFNKLKSKYNWVIN